MEDLAARCNRRYGPSQRGSRSRSLSRFWSSLSSIFSPLPDSGMLAALTSFVLWMRRFCPTALRKKDPLQKTRPKDASPTPTTPQISALRALNQQRVTSYANHTLIPHFLGFTNMVLEGFTNACPRGDQQAASRWIWAFLSGNGILGVVWTWSWSFIGASPRATHYGLVRDVRDVVEYRGAGIMCRHQYSAFLAPLSVCLAWDGLVREKLDCAEAAEAAAAEEVDSKGVVKN